MEKNKVNSQTILRVAMIVSFLLFVLSSCSFVYFRLYFNDSIAVASFIKALADTMQGTMGYIFYIAGPAVIVLSLVVWNLLPNRMGRVICESDNAVLQVKDVKMQETPFQEVNANSHDIINDVITQTLKSPMQSQKVDISVNNLGSNENNDGTKQFAPKYIFEKDISSIKELKEVIAKSKMPEVLILTDGDISNLSNNCKEKIQRINSFDVNKVIAHIKQKNIEIQKLSESKHIFPKLTYKVVSKHTKISEKKEIEESKQNMPNQSKYLTADEIIELHRKEVASKKFTPTFVSTDFEDENNGLNDLAKLYYESQIEEYATKE